LGPSVDIVAKQTLPPKGTRAADAVDQFEVRFGGGLGGRQSAEVKR
jgi:hypothetical protein